MWGLRLGDDVDDFCVKCKRVTNHSVLAIVDEAPARVRCRTCYAEQDFRNCVAPPTKRELKKAAEAAAAEAAEQEARALAEAEAAAAEAKAAARKGGKSTPKARKGAKSRK
jgi:hypothetical protein